MLVLKGMLEDLLRWKQPKIIARENLASKDSYDLGSKRDGFLGHTPSTAGTFRKKFRKNSGKTPETLSERFLEFPSRVRLGCPKPYNSRHLRLPEHFQNYLPPSTAGGASFFRSGSGEGLPEPVMEFPAVLGVFLITIAVVNCYGRVFSMAGSLRHEIFWRLFTPEPSSLGVSTVQDAE